MTRDEPAGEAATTDALARWIASIDDRAVSPAAFEWARHALLDWLAVTVAARDEPLVGMLFDEYADADGPCTVVGRRQGLRALDAALVNGAAGHALDYDDVAARMVGHPTVPVAPAALAEAESLGADGRALLRAIVVGHQIESEIGSAMGQSHYARGFHVTGTVGTFGAAAACANLRRLDAPTTRHALGLAAAQAAGLKSMFGTMAKPLHAGKAAMNGALAARLAARGFTANDSAIECPQGFIDTQAPEPGPPVAAVDTSAGFAIERTLFKYHAACYLTHSTIEAVRRLRTDHGVSLDDLESMTVSVAGNQRGVCDIEDPRSGLAVKFSIKHLAALALDGADTASLGLYDDATARDERIGAARRRVELETARRPDRDVAVVTLTTRDGRRLEASANVAVPATDPAAQWTRLVDKARSIAVPVMGEARFERMVEAVRGLERAPDLASLTETLR